MTGLSDVGEADGGLDYQPMPNRRRLYPVLGGSNHRNVQSVKSVSGLVSETDGSDDSDMPSDIALLHELAAHMSRVVSQLGPASALGCALKPVLAELLALDESSSETLPASTHPPKLRLLTGDRQ